MDLAVLTIIVDNPYENLTNANKRSQHATHHLEMKGVNVPHKKGDERSQCATRQERKEESTRHSINGDEKIRCHT